MHHSERIFNVLLGLSILSWAILGIANSPGQRPVSVGGSIAALHLLVGLLILTRKAADKNGSMGSILLASPAILVGGFAFTMPIHWDRVNILLLLAGTLMTMLSFFYLGKSFAVLPAIRKVVQKGPYCWVRHPAYLGQLIMLLACAIGSRFLVGSGLLLLAVVFVVIRIKVEERLLLENKSYQEYVSKVTWRLIPGIW